MPVAATNSSVVSPTEFHLTAGDNYIAVDVVGLCLLGT